MIFWRRKKRLVELGVKIHQIGRDFPKLLESHRLVIYKSAGTALRGNHAAEDNLLSRGICKLSLHNTVLGCIAEG